MLAQTVVARNIAGQTTQRQYNYDSYRMLGYANTDCGKMTSDLRDNRKGWELDYMTYATGFLTGANYHACVTKRGNPKVGQGTSAEALLAAVEQYCGQYPLKKVVDALDSVYLQLSVK